jgi:hypothetical protein
METTTSSRRSSRHNSFAHKDEDSCGICLDKYHEQNKQIVLHDFNDDVKHTFHKSCIQKWFDRGKCVCPLCRTLIKDHADVKCIEKQILCVSCKKPEPDLLLHTDHHVHTSCLKNIAEAVMCLPDRVGVAARCCSGPSLPFIEMRNIPRMIIDELARKVDNGTLQLLLQLDEENYIKYNAKGTRISFRINGKLFRASRDLGKSSVQNIDMMVSKYVIQAKTPWQRLCDGFLCIPQSRSLIERMWDETRSILWGGGMFVAAHHPRGRAKG